MYDNFENICPNCFNESGGEICRNCSFDSRKMPKSNAILEPFTILNGRYLLGRILGQGGFGITYLAKDLQTNDIVAIKEYMPSEFAQRNRDNTISATNPENNDFFERSKASFNSEAKTLYELEDNSFVVNVINYFSENNTEYFVMEYLDGVNLKTLFRSNNNRISYDNALFILLTIGSALMEIHRMNILHRDISPENIMATRDGSVKLIDFGASRSYSDNRTRNGMTVLYKPGFAPPEQYDRSGKQGPWSDIYALAATFYYMVSGVQLKDAQSRLIDDTEYIPLKSRNCDVPEIVSDVIDKALELDYTRRYTDVKDMLDDLSVVLNDVNGIDQTMINHVNRQKDSQINQNKIEYSNQFVANQKPYLQVVSGIHRGQRVRIPDSGYTIVGRSAEVSNFVVDDYPEISRQHCKVRYNAEINKFIVVDTSSNGTFFSDGSRMPYSAEVVVNVDDIIYIYNETVAIKVTLD